MSFCTRNRAVWQLWLLYADWSGSNTSKFVIIVCSVRPGSHCHLSLFPQEWYFGDWSVSVWWFRVWRSKPGFSSNGHAYASLKFVETTFVSRDVLIILFMAGTNSSLHRFQYIDVSMRSRAQCFTGALKRNLATPRLSVWQEGVHAVNSQVTAPQAGSGSPTLPGCLPYAAPDLGKCGPPA